MSSHFDKSSVSTASMLSFHVNITVLIVLDFQRFEKTCSIHLQPLKMKAIRLFETSEMYDPVTKCNTPEDLSYNRDAFRLHLHCRHYFSVSRACQGCFFLHCNLSISLSMQYRRFVFILPSVSGSSRASVVTKRITRRQYKRKRVKE